MSQLARAAPAQEVALKAQPTAPLTCDLQAPPPTQEAGCQGHHPPLAPPPLSDLGGGSRVEPRDLHFQQVAGGGEGGSPGAHPSRTSASQLAVTSDLGRDPLLKINFNLFFPASLPQKNSKQHYQPLIRRRVYYFYVFSTKLPGNSKGNYIQRELGPQRKSTLFI